MTNIFLGLQPIILINVDNIYIFFYDDSESRIKIQVKIICYYLSV